MKTKVKVKHLSKAHREKIRRTLKERWATIRTSQSNRLSDVCKELGVDYLGPAPAAATARGNG